MPKTAQISLGGLPTWINDESGLRMKITRRYAEMSWVITLIRSNGEQLDIVIPERELLEVNDVLVQDVRALIAWLIDKQVDKDSVALIRNFVEGKALGHVVQIKNSY